MTELTMTVVGFGYRDEWRQFIAGMMLQTDPDFRCQLINDGPDDEAFEIVRPLIGSDQRFTWLETKERFNDWGHSLRVLGLAECETPWWCTQNADNQLVPGFVETVMAEAHRTRATARGDVEPDVVIFPCVHNYPNVNNKKDPPYSVLDVSLRRNRCDAGTIVLRTSLAQKVGWQSLDSAADGDFVEDVRRTNPVLARLPNVLMVHN